jgi:hypothetical protein
MRNDLFTEKVRQELLAPIPPEEIGWKPQVTRDDSALMVAYVDARWVAERLDEATGGDWHFEWDYLGADSGSVVVKGRLTVCGIVREDVGEHPASDKIDPFKSAVSDALKRTAVLFGVGRELYRMESQWIKWDSAKKRPMPGEMERLIQRLRPRDEKPKDDKPWVQDKESVQAFFKWAQDSKGIGGIEALVALDVQDIREYKGTKQDALAAITEYGKK